MFEKHKEILEEAYLKASKILKNNNNIPIANNKIDFKLINHLDIIFDHVEDFLGVVNVLITSLAEKTINKKQDIRKHQSKMEGGYSGRSLDTKVVTPFLKSKQLKSMKESGWLTRSLEQHQPYSLNYRGAIRNKDVKDSFLKTLDAVQKGINPKLLLEYSLQRLIIQREKEKIKINPLKNKSEYRIEEIINLIKKHFEESKKSGKALLPVLVIYTIYECMLDQVDRYKNKVLKPLGSHHSADFRSGSIGDIQVYDKKDKPFEGVEIKYNKEINHIMVTDAFEKFKEEPVKRYYILSTLEPSNEELKKINEVTDGIESIHGCQIIVNGILPCLNYYLRLLNDVDLFIEKYTSNIIRSKDLKIEHKEIWKKLIESGYK